MSDNPNSSAIQVHRVFIKATPEAIWDALTRPELIERYGYLSRAQYDLRAGGKFQAFANAQQKNYGAPDVIIDGEVIEIQPQRKLVQTWHPLFDAVTRAEPPTRLTHEIEPLPQGYCRVTLTHDVTTAPSLVDVVSGANPQAGGGWPFILSDLKSMLETGRAMAA